MAKIRGGQVKSLAALKKSIKKSSGGGMITRIPKDAPLTARFLEEPDRWFEYYEHFDTSANKGFICVADDCKGCADDMRTSKRLLANAVDTDKSIVVALAMPTSLVNILLKRYDRNGTLLDREWELSRSGAGLETEYDATSDGRTKFNFSVYEPLDLNEILASQVEGESEEDDTADDDTDDEDPPWEEKKPPSGTKRRIPGAQRINQDPWAEDEDAEDTTPSRRVLKRAAPPATIGRRLNISKAGPGKSLGKR